MKLMLIYSMFTTLLLMMIWVVYRVTLARTTHHSFNRLLLMFVVVVSVVAPAFQLIRHPSVETVSAIPLDVYEVALPKVEVHISTRSVETFRFLSMLYVAGIVFVLIKYAVSLWRLAAVVRRSRPVEFYGRRVYIHDDSSLGAFTWGRFIVMSRSDYENNAQMILAHEMAHLDQGHWIDLVLMQCVAAFTWYSPFSWLIRRELQLEHEFLADARVLASHGVLRVDYQMLLIEKTVGSRFQSIANSINNSSIKLRINQMMKKRSKGIVRIRALALVPAMALVFMACGSDSAKSVVNDIVSSDSISDGKVSQNSVDGKVPDVGSTEFADSVYSIVDVMPEFSGGVAGISKFLRENINYPAECIEKNEQGTVVVKFVVYATGKVGYAEVVKSVSAALDAEALRVVGKMPDFKPGRRKDGKPVNVSYTMPIRFIL